MKKLDEILNTIPMYRLVVYGLGALVALSGVLSLLGRLPFEPSHLLISLCVVLGASFVTEFTLSRLWGVPSNSESWLITALILFLIISPASSIAGVLAIGLAGGTAIASKYILAWKGKQLFNPAAFGASFLSLLALHPVTWWVGSAVFWPFTLLLGLIIVRKIRRFSLVGTFVVVAVVLRCGLLLGSTGSIDSSTLQSILFASPLIFLSTIMLTEPATMPSRFLRQIIFSAVIAVLYVMAWHIGPLYIYPEVALLVGNILAFVVSPKANGMLTLQEIQKISPQVYNYIFRPEQPFRFLPGQYMEWTLAGVPFDERGNRRTFTIASSPTEDTVQIGVKFYNPSSTYKAVLRAMQPGDTIHASHLAGNFTLPRGNKKLALFAGGIGITPFRSMVKYVQDTGQQRDIVLLYTVKDISELAYKEVFAEAAKVGVKAYAVTNKLTPEVVQQYIPDVADRLCYISGPHGMVEATKEGLQILGVVRRHIKTDHFSGY